MPWQRRSATLANVSVPAFGDTPAARFGDARSGAPERRALKRRGCSSAEDWAGRNVGVVQQPPSGTVSFLFTDIEGSTRRWEDETVAMREELARHDAILRGAVEAHQGHVLKSTGDGVLAVFARAGDAIGAAVDAQVGWACTQALPKNATATISGRR